MERIIKIDDKDVRLNNNLAWTMEYRDQFGRDVVSEHLPMLATIAEMVATIIGNTGKGEGLTAADVLEAIEGQTVEIMLPLSQAELMTTLVNVTWAMAKAADDGILPPKQWARQFDTFPVDEIAPVVYDMAISGLASSKNLQRLRSLGRALKDEETTQPQHSTTSFSPEQSEG